MLRSMMTTRKRTEPPNSRWLSELVSADALRPVADAFAAPLPLPHSGRAGPLKSSRFSLVERLEKSERRRKLDEGESGFASSAGVLVACDAPLQDRYVPRVMMSCSEL